MKRQLMQLFALIIFFTDIFCMTANAADSRNHDINVWPVPVENSDIIGFKAQTIVNAPINRVYGVIIDTNNAHEWVPYTGKITILKDQIKQLQTALLHYIIDMPFPLSDRDVVIVSRIDRDQFGNISIINTAKKDTSLAVQPDMVRVTQYHGSWLLESINADQTRVTLSGHANMGGNIPAWVANIFATKQPHEMLENIKKQVKKPRYKNTKIDF